MPKFHQDTNFENFVDSKISEGRFKNTSEVIHVELRLLEKKILKIPAYKYTIIERIESGIGCS